MPSSMRPPESWSIVAAVIAVIAGLRAGIWKIAEPSLIVDVRPGQPAEDRRGVRAVGLGGPDGVIAQPLGLLDDLALIVGGQAQIPSIRCARRASRLQDPFQRQEFGCRSKTA